jgi:hypothetical protein
MSYVLLWIAVLTVSLFWTATLISGCTRRVAWLAGIAPISLSMLYVVCYSAALKYERHLHYNWFTYSVPLFVAYFVGAFVLLRRASEKRASKGTFRLALITLMAGFLAAAIYRNLDANARAHCRILHDEAERVTLSQNGHDIPEGQNAGSVYEMAFSRMKEDTSLCGEKSLLDLDEYDFKVPRLIAMFDRQEPTIQLLRQAGRLPECRFTHNYSIGNFFAPFPQLNDLRNAVKLLALHAKLEVANHRIDSAIADVNAIYRASDALGRYPHSGVELLVSMGLRALGRDALQCTLPSILEGKQLAAFEVAPTSNSAAALAGALECEEAFGVSFLADMCDEKSWLSDSSAIRWANDHPAPVQASLLRIFLIPHDAAAYRDTIRQIRQIGGLPYPRMKTSMAGVEPLFRRTGLVAGPMVSIMAPSYEMLFSEVARDDAGRELDRIALAMTRYRLEHGTFVESLDRLIPGYLDKVPVDPFDGKPLRFLHKADQWIVYSVGPDGKDDGGVTYNPSTKGIDVPFVLTIK